MQFEAKIASVFTKKSLSLDTFSILKNSFNVGTSSFIAFSATFFEGSIPKIFFLFSKKFFNKVPSFEPISISFELDNLSCSIACCVGMDIKNSDIIRAIPKIDKTKGILDDNLIRYDNKMTFHIF